MAPSGRVTLHTSDENGALVGPADRTDMTGADACHGAATFTPGFANRAAVRYTRNTHRRLTPEAGAQVGGLSPVAARS